MSSSQSSSHRRCHQVFISLLVFLAVIRRGLPRSGFSGASFSPGKSPPSSFGPLVADACSGPVLTTNERRLRDCQVKRLSLNLLLYHILPSREQVANGIKVFVILMSCCTPCFFAAVECTLVSRYAQVDRQTDSPTMLFAFGNRFRHDFGLDFLSERPRERVRNS